MFGWRVSLWLRRISNRNLAITSIIIAILGIGVTFVLDDESPSNLSNHEVVPVEEDRAIAVPEILPDHLKPSYLSNQDIVSAGESASLVPEIVEAEEIGDLRKRNEVRQLRISESGAKLFEVPDGIYGYVAAQDVDIDRIPHLTIMKDRMRMRCLEVHKVGGERILVTGFLSESDLSRVVSPSRANAIDIIVFCEPYKEYRFLTAIPITRITTWKGRYDQDVGFFSQFSVK